MIEQNSASLKIGINAITNHLVLNGLNVRRALVEQPFTKKECELKLSSPNKFLALFSLCWATLLRKTPTYPWSLSKTSEGCVLTVITNPFSGWDHGTCRAYLVKSLTTKAGTTDVSEVKVFPELNPEEILGEPDGLSFCVSDKTTSLCLNGQARVKSVLVHGKNGQPDHVLTLLSRDAFSGDRAGGNEIFPFTFFLDTNGYQLVASKDKYPDPHAALYKYPVKGIVLENGHQIDLSPYRAPIRSPWVHEKLNADGSDFRSHPRMICNG